jgi:hypothetical protein
MTSIVATGAMAVSLPFVAYAVFLAVARGVREDDDYEVEVKLLPPTFRLKVERNDRHHRGSEAVHISMSDHVAARDSQPRLTRAEPAMKAKLGTPPRRHEQTEAEIY